MRTMTKATIAAAWLGLGLVGCGGSTGDPDPDPDPPGEPIGNPVTVTIGPAGGTLETADGGFALVVPPGAVTEPTAISVQPVTNTAPNSYGHAYRIEPRSLRLASPAELTLSVDELLLGGAPAELVGIGLRHTNGDWYGLPGSAGQSALRNGMAGGALARRDGRVVSVTRVSLGDDWVEYTISAQWIVMPTQPISVEPTQSVMLRVLACTQESERSSMPGPDGEDALPALPQCQPSIREGTWYVEDTRGGDARVGFVAAGNPTSTAEFLAPNRAPTPNPVTVKVTLFWRERGLTSLPLKIPIGIKSRNMSGTATGTLGSVAGALYSYSANVTWVPEELPSNVVIPIVTYRPTGTVTVTALHQCVTNLQPTVITIDPQLAGSLRINTAAGTWEGGAAAAPPSGIFDYHDSCADSPGYLPALLPLLEGPGNLTPDGHVTGSFTTASSGVTGTFSYAPE